MSWLPDVSRTNPGPVDRYPRQVEAAAQAQRSTELEIFRHGLNARLLAECDRLDSQAMGDALRAALDEELDLLDYGLQKAGGSVAKTALVAQKVELFSARNNRRISDRFGR